jgi:osmotically-inducible protein OsmY
MLGPGEPMKSDSDVKDDVLDELRWDPQIPEPDAIGVAVTAGAVTLSGHVSTYVQKLAAARAVERVYGVRAVASEIKVEHVHSMREANSAKAAAAAAPGIADVESHLAVTP